MKVRTVFAGSARKAVCHKIIRFERGEIMKRLLSILVLGLLLGPSVTICPAAEFGSNSADLTGLFSFKQGDRLISMGCAANQYFGQVFYLDAMDIEEVEEIRSLKVNAVTDGTLVTLWLAQDTGGTIWVLQVLFHANNEVYTRGNGIIHPFLPANPQIDHRVSLSWPETERQCKITQVGVALPKTCWGIGPFAGCIEVRCGEIPNFDEEIEYLCPGVGPVKYLREGVEARQLKEVVRNDCPADLDRNRAVDGKDLARFAEEYGGMCP